MNDICQHHCFGCEFKFKIKWTISSRSSSKFVTNFQVDAVVVMATPVIISHRATDMFPLSCRRQLARLPSNSSVHSLVHVHLHGYTLNPSAPRRTAVCLRWCFEKWRWRKWMNEWIEFIGFGNRWKVNVARDRTRSAHQRVRILTSSEPGVNSRISKKPRYSQLLGATGGAKQTNKRSFVGKSPVLHVFGALHARTNRARVSVRGSWFYLY